MSENIIPLGSSSRTPATSDPRRSSRSTATAPAAGARKRKGMDEEALAELQRQEREEDSSSDDEEPAAPPRKMPKGKGKGTETKNVGKGKGRGKKEKPEKTPKATQPTEPPVITPPGKGYGTVQLKLATTFFFKQFLSIFSSVLIIQQCQSIASCHFRTYFQLPRGLAGPTGSESGRQAALEDDNVEATPSKPGRSKGPATKYSSSYSTVWHLPATWLTCWPFL